MQFRWKIRAKLLAITQRIPAAFIAAGTFSRDEPGAEVRAGDEDRVADQLVP